MGKNMSGLFSSNTDEWATPQDLFDRLNEEFGFDLDVCANEENAKCPTFFTKEQDGLSKSWHGRRVFCNPPYDRRVGSFMKKAYEETAMGGGNHMRDAGGRKNGYEMVAGLRNASIRDQTHPWTAEIRRRIIRSAVPVCDSDLWHAEVSEILNIRGVR